MRRRSIVAAAAAAVTVLATALVAATSSSAATSTTPVPNTFPTWVAKTAPQGNSPASQAVSGRIYLQPNGGLAPLIAKAYAVSTPGSPSYGQFITPAYWDKFYAPTFAQVMAVEAYLKRNHLFVTGVGPDNRYVSFVGSVAAANGAFSTTIKNYNHNGQQVQAPSTALRVPSDIAPTVLAISGLDTTPHLAKPASTQDAPPPAGFRVGTPCSSYYGQKTATTLPAFKGNHLPYAICGYSGSQLHSAYVGNSSLSGAGVTVAITDAYAAPTIVNDITQYASNTGGAPYAPGQFTQTKPPAYNSQKACGPSGWYGEETLDIEAVHAIAPAANIHYYAGASCNDDDLLDALINVIDDDTAQLVSNSWGDVEANESPNNVLAYESVFVQGALEGISFMYSSGDNGDELANTGIKQADYPTSDPFVTSVGGTSTAIGKNGSIMWQTGWGTDKWSLSSDKTSWDFVGYLYGAGGGTSTLFPTPPYQAGVTGSAWRQDPDVAMDADTTTGMLVGETQTFSDGVYYDQYRIGGTSLASPLFTGMAALAVQRAGHGVGLLNPTIYANPGAFTDVLGNPPDAGNVRVDFANGENATDGKVYSVRTFDQDSSLRTTPGYDLVTGLGVPNHAWFNAIR